MVSNSNISEESRRLMSFIGKSGLVWLVLVGLMVKPALLLACSENSYPDQFAGRFSVDVSARYPVLVSVHNFNTDLFLVSEHLDSVILNSPGGRNTADYLFVESVEGDEQVEICVFSKFRNAAQPQYFVQQFTLDAVDTEEVEILSLLNDAAKSWASGGFDDVEEAERIYSMLANVEYSQTIRDSDFSFYMALFATQANFTQRRYGEAENQLQELASQEVDLPSAYQLNLLLGKIKLRQGAYGEAESLFENVRVDLLEGVQRDGSLAYDLADADIMLGEIYATTGQLELAAQRLQEARENAQPDFELLGHINNNSAYLSVRRSEQEGVPVSQKVDFLEEAVERTLIASYFYTEAGDTFSRQIAENNAAIDYVRLGDRRKSLLHFSNLIELLQDFPNPTGRAFYFSNISNYMSILGDYTKAQAYIEEAIRLSVGSDSRRIPGYHCRLGTLQRQQNNLEEAIESHQKCHDLARPNEWMEYVTEALLELSIDHSQLDDLANSKSYLDQALDSHFLIAVEDPNITKRLYTQLGEISLLTGELDAAESAVIRSIETEIDGRFFNDHIDALFLAQRIYEAQGEVQKAIDQANDTLSEIEVLYSQLDPEKLGPAWGNQTNRVYQHLIEIYLSLYNSSGLSDHLSRAFHTIERSLDPGMRQHLSVNLSHDVVSLEEQERIRLFSEISNNLANFESSLQMPPLEMMNYYHQHDLLSLARLNNIERIDVPEPLSLERIHSELLPHQLVLYYVPQGENLRLLLIDHESIRLGKMVNAEKIKSLSLESANAINLVSDDAKTTLVDLSLELLPDFSEFPGKTELLLVNQGGLETLPFAALSSSSNSYVPLIESYVLKYVPSVSSYLMDKPEKQTAGNNRIAIFADPVFSEIQLSSIDRFSTDISDLRGWSDSLQPLPFSALEAERIAMRFPGKADIFTGTRASRENLSNAEVRSSKVLHLATHGYFKSLEEDKLGLAFSSIDENGNPIPGFVTLTELFSYSFNNELVVISGCETALGQDQAGIGLNSLTRGFLVQGVKHVIATLWPVSDRASAAFMAMFYENLERSQNIALALQLAQKQMSESDNYSHPFYWAAYTLTSTSSDSSLQL